MKRIRIPLRGNNEGHRKQRRSPSSRHLTTSQLSDPTILAALLVPEIEAFLATNISTGVLILHFPFTYLDVVFELCKLLRPDLFKIAGTLDSLAPDAPSTSRPTSKHPSNSLSNDAVATRNNIRPKYLKKSESQSDFLFTLKQPITFINLQPKTGVTSFAKADFVLSSIATGVEITDFLAGICRALIESSSFYTPEPEPAKESVMPGGLRLH